jgi:hypothetical protein
VRTLARIFYGVGAFGIAIAGVKSAPMLWDVDPLSCVIICASVALAAVTQIERAVSGEW